PDRGEGAAHGVDEFFGRIGIGADCSLAPVLPAGIDDGVDRMVAARIGLGAARLVDCGRALRRWLVADQALGLAARRWPHRSSRPLRAPVVALIADHGLG